MSTAFTKNLRREVLRREQVAVGAPTKGRLFTWADLFRHLTEIGMKDASPIRTVASLKALLGKLDMVELNDRAHLVISSSTGKRTLSSCVLTVSAGGHPLVAAATAAAFTEIVGGDLVRGKALARRLPIVPARADDFIAESAIRFDARGAEL